MYSNRISTVDEEISDLNLQYRT